MSGVSGGSDRGSVMADYGHNAGNIEAMTRDAGIKDNGSESGWDDSAE
jgi:conjugal transfer mating pair stabilization protein TraG